MNFKKIFSLILFIFVISSCFPTLCACQRTTKDVFFAMDTIMTVEINGSADDIEEVKKIIENAENSLSVTLSSSAVHSLNALKSFDFNEEYVNLVSRCVEISNLTDGFFSLFKVYIGLENIWAKNGDGIVTEQTAICTQAIGKGTSFYLFTVIDEYGR